MDIERRWRWHRNNYDNKNEASYNCYLYRSIRKYKLENFKFEILEECSVEKLNERERFWIKYYESNDIDKGYNLTSGGDSGGYMSDEARKKLSEAAKI